MTWNISHRGYGFLGKSPKILRMMTDNEAWQKRYHTLVSQQLVGLAEADSEGTLTFVNDRYCQILGQSRESLVRHATISSLTHPDDWADYSQRLEQLAADGVPFISDKRYLRPDRSEVWVRNFVTLHHDEGRPAGFLAVVTDISDAKASEHRLAEELLNAKLLQRMSLRLLGEDDANALLHEMLIAVVEIAGAEGGTLQLYDGRAELHLKSSVGFAEDDAAMFSKVLAAYAEELDLTSESSRCTSTSDVEAQGSYRDEARDVLRRLGVRVVCSTPLISRAGRLLGVFSTKWSHPHITSAVKLQLMDNLSRQAADLLERVEAQRSLQSSEEHLRQLSLSLENRVAERTEALEAQTERLRELTNQLALNEQRERQRLASVLHDGLQQLLVAASLHLPPSDEEAPVSLGRARELMLEAIEACRSLSWELSPPWLAESTLARSLSWLARWFRDHHHHQVKISVQPGFPELREERKMILYWAVRELLLNSVKHSGVRQVRVTLRCSQTGQVELEVSDTGRGFSPKDVFDSGCQLGLHSIKERLAALNGELTIRSSPGGGATFLLSVPLQR